jgi:hypothetical protein
MMNKKTKAIRRERKIRRLRNIGQYDRYYDQKRTIREARRLARVSS